ncbi:MAG: hypothetical protein PHT00_02730 [Candidatus Methanomethylophilus sp.]|nr:hypothetical protein [Methanomethylophilus sp.]MDD3233068.1 hypothetical protein [Methanomethylophilus sp.]MDD4222521.1 hypothetical protein [Methanomethylophilus sp.]MDD4668444.1 hypothetical protein [Methanomethylophilus sp.]
MVMVDEHLEQALQEYNDKVNALEPQGTSQELLDAYLNRGSVLSLLESYVSAITDFDDAVALIKVLENSGHPVDAGCFVKAYVSRGELRNDDDTGLMKEDYIAAAARVPELRENSRYYDRKKTVEMCLNVAGDLLDADYPVETAPFLDKALSYLVGNDDNWSRNCYTKACNLTGQAAMDEHNNTRAREEFTETIRVATDLKKAGKLEDELELVYAYVSRGDVEDDMQDTEPYLADRLAAIDLMEDMLKRNALDDTELLANLHGEVAQLYMRKNEMKKAERHLMRQVAINLDGAREYMRDQQIDDGTEEYDFGDRDVDGPDE